MTLDFVAIDFETANEYRGSPCAVGLVRVLNGEIVDRQARLIKPVTRDWNPKKQPLHTLFSPFNIMIHGITPDDVKDAPAWHEIWPTLQEYIGELPVVAHNASFDTGVIRYALDADGDPWPTLSYLCTVTLSRVTYDIVSHSLPYVAEAAGVNFDEDRHHQADYDAELAARIMLAITKHYGASSIAEVASAAGVRIGTITPDKWLGSTKIGSQSGAQPRAIDVEVNQDADPSHYLWGKRICFTGALSITRVEAWAMVAKVGGKPVDGVTNVTDLLVVGQQDEAKLRPGAEMSSKQAKAKKLRAGGQRIEMMDENEFRRMIAEVTDEGARSGA